MHIELGSVRAFVAVADAGAINRAAQVVHLSQPAVTRHVQRLEAALGAQLLDRRARPATLTPAGRQAVEVCRQVLKTLGQLRAVGDGGAGPTGECRIGIAHALANLALAEPIDGVRRQFPKLQLQVTTGWSADVLDRVRSGQLDLGVVYLPEGQTPPAELRVRVLAVQPLMVAAPRSWKRRRLDLKALGGADWVLNPQGCGFRGALQRRLADIGATFRVAVEVHDLQTQLSLVARGVGLALVPGWIAATSPYRHHLRFFGVRGLPLRLSIWALRGSPLAILEPVLTSLEDRLAAVLTKRGRRPSRPAA